MSGPLDGATVATLRARLAEERARTVARVTGLTRDFDAIVDAAEASNADDEHDPEGQTIGFERAQVSALLGDAAARLADLDRASDRLDAGTYGRCSRCGAAIGVDRLEVAPTTDLCITCAGATTRTRR